MNSDDQDARIKELEACRDDWQASIDRNFEHLERLTRLKLKGIDEYDAAIARSVDADKNLKSAKANIEATIQRVKAGGR